jgi:hypothetical protein
LAKGRRGLISSPFLNMTTWRKLITYAFDSNKESWNDVESISPKDEKWLDFIFNDDHGHIQGESFTVWTKSRVYFPATYDGAEWVESVSRNPDNNPTTHIGG